LTETHLFWKAVVTFFHDCGMVLVGDAVRGLLSGLQLLNGPPAACFPVPLRLSKKLPEMR